MIYNQNVSMEFAIEKCAMLIMKIGEGQITERIDLPNQEKIRTIEEKENNKYMGILESDSIKQAKIKIK